MHLIWKVIHLFDNESICVPKNPSMLGPLASRACQPEPSLSYHLPGLGRKCIPRWYTNQPSPSETGENLHMVWGNLTKKLGKNGVFHVSEFSSKFSGYQIGLDDDLQHVARTFPSIHWHCLQLHLSWHLGWWRSDGQNRSVEKMNFMLQVKFTGEQL